MRLWRKSQGLSEYLAFSSHSLNKSRNEPPKGRRQVSSLPFSPAHEEIGGTANSLEQLRECKKTLKEVEIYLLKFTPRENQKLEEFFKAVKYVLKKEETKTLLDRLERQKQTFQLALFALSTYSELEMRFNVTGTCIFRNRMPTRRNVPWQKTSGRVIKLSVNVGVLLSKLTHSYLSSNN